MTDFVLVPGAGGAAWYWHRLVPELTRRGHRAVAVDLPAADDSAGLEEYADVVTAAAAGLERPVVVGQSMGGLCAPLVCARRPVAALVLLNAMIPRPGESGAQWWVDTGHEAAFSALAEREGRSPEFDVEELFFHDVPAEVTAEAFAQSEPEQSDAPFAAPWPLDAWPDVPVHVLHGRDDRFFPLEFARRLAAERLGAPVEVLPGGHLLALSRPVELADALCRAAATHAG